MIKKKKENGIDQKKKGAVKKKILTAKKKKKIRRELLGLKVVQSYLLVGSYLLESYSIVWLIQKSHTTS